MREKPDWFPIVIIMAVIGGGGLIFELARCGFSSDARQCSSWLAIRIFAEILKYAGLGGAAWLGYTVGVKTNKNRLGWLTFVAALLAIFGFLSFTGLPLGYDSDDDY
jgi:hypothetical protein